MPVPEPVPQGATSVAASVRPPSSVYGPGQVDAATTVSSYQMKAPPASRAWKRIVSMLAAVLAEAVSVSVIVSESIDV